jgi:hypothetical protein
MRVLPFVILSALLCATVTAQKSDLAIATYSKNGRIISLTNLSGLSDCPSKSAMGKVSSVDINGDIARVRLNDKKIDADVDVPLSRVSADDRKIIFRNFLSKKARLRVAGYACTQEAAITAFSIDRIY